MECSCTERNKANSKVHVEGYGPSDPPIMFIGEGPGADEDQLGVPFAGGAGRVLHAWCGQAGFRRDDCYIDNVVQHRPPDNDINQADVSGEAANVLRRILRVNPRLVVLLGNTALQVFVDGTISDYRGAYFPITVGGRTFKALATLHPAFIMRQRRLWDVCVADLRKAKRLASTPGPWKEPEHQYNTMASQTDLDRLVEEALDTDADLTVDIETDMQGTAVDLVGLSIRPGSALVTDPNEFHAVRTLLRLFRGCRKVTTQNGWTFDIPKLRENGFPIGPPRHDTLLYSQLLYPHLPRNLGFLTSLYCDFRYHKNLMNVDKRWYCCRDVDATQIIRSRQLGELEELGLLHLSKVVMRYANVVMYMKTHGMQVDINLMKQLHNEKMMEEAKDTLILQNITGDKYFSPLSPAQVKAAFERLQVHIPYNRKTRSYNTDKDQIKRIKASYASNAAVVQFCDMLQRVRGDRKLASTYYSAPVDASGRIHPNWKMASQAGEEDEDLK